LIASANSLLGGPNPPEAISISIHRAAPGASSILIVPLHHCPMKQCEADGALGSRGWPSGGLIAVNGLSGIPGEGPPPTIGTPTLILMHCGHGVSAALTSSVLTEARRAP
jgi:hypothetical protein